jgi:PPOX class probable F420-dependent enzyme
MTELPAGAIELLRGRTMAHLATVNADGSPTVSPLWIDIENGKPVFNTAVGRRKERNMRRDPRVALTVPDPADAYRCFEIRGTVELLFKGADEHIEQLARKYTGQPFKGFQPGVARVKIVMTPQRVLEH